MTGPLIPRDVDLRAFRTMPLDIDALDQSDFADRVSDAEFRAAITLWGKSYHQVPAGSLPDDDVKLAKLSGFGRAVDAWRRVKRGALYGFEKGGDGRLYHRYIVRVAFFEGWVGHRLPRLWEMENDRIRKQNAKADPSKRLPTLSVVDFVRLNYPDTAAYLDKLEELRPPIGWALLAKRGRRSPALPETLPPIPERKSPTPENRKIPEERYDLNAGTDELSGGIPSEERAAEPETALNRTEQEIEQIPPLPPDAGGGGQVDADFAAFYAVGGERWSVLRADRALVEWEARLREGHAPALLIAAARAYFAQRDELDQRSKRVGTVVSPATFLRGHWMNFRGVAELMIEADGNTGPDLGEVGERLREHFGAAKYAALFDGATIDGATIVVKRPSQRIMIEREVAAIERCMGVTNLAVVVSP